MKIECPECGGLGGEDAANFGDRGWHPCYYCGATGTVDYSTWSMSDLVRDRHFDPARDDMASWLPPAVRLLIENKRTT